MLKTMELVTSPLNNSNDTSPSGFSNTYTGYQTNAGGLVLGDMFDCDNQFAYSQSYFSQLTNSFPNGILFQGRYRRVQVAAGATAADVGRGKACYVTPGVSLFGALVLTQGSGQTVGTYTVAGSGGGGTGAIIQISVLTATTVSTPIVVAAGSGYTSAPTFTIPSGGTPATVQAQMSYEPYIVSPFSTSGVITSEPRGLFLNSITPGNYGWIQENGIASFLVDSTAGTATAGVTLTPITPSTVPGAFRGVIATTAPPTSSFGTAIDALVASQYVRGVMNIPVWNG